MTKQGAEAVNELDERIRRESGLWVPKMNRKHCGGDAPILSVGQDPGRGTNRPGVLCTDNEDPTSRRQRDLMTATGMSRRDLCPWNAYPWQHDTKTEGPLTPEKVARGAVVSVK